MARTTEKFIDRITEALLEAKSLYESGDDSYKSYDQCFVKRKLGHYKREFTDPFILDQIDICRENIVSMQIACNAHRCYIDKNITPWTKLIGEDESAFQTEQDAIEFLKAKGYKILRPKVEYEEM